MKKIRKNISITTFAPIAASFIFYIALSSVLLMGYKPPASFADFESHVFINAGSIVFLVPAPFPSGSSSTVLSELAPKPEQTAIPVCKITTPFLSSDSPVYVDGFLDPRSVTPTMVPDASSITVLVNKYNAVSQDYVPSLVLAESSNNRYIRSEAADAWNLMRVACYDATGKTLYLVSGYRSYSAQKSSFENALTWKGLTRAISKYAYPGRSEHQLGLALDIATTDSKKISADFLETTAGAWMAEHSYEYGFILRYPSGKESITGYAFEAWHYRYVGVDPATAMHDNGLTLEEYLGTQ